MAEMILREGDVGVTMSISLGEDIADASLVEIVLLSPSARKKTVTAAASGSAAVYVTEAGVFDEDGLWSGQVHVVQPSKDRLSQAFDVHVARAL